MPALASRWYHSDLTDWPSDGIPLMRLLRFLSVMILVGACALPQIDVPDDDRLSRADYPRLQPLSQLLRQADSQPARVETRDAFALRARADALRARAALLRQNALTEADRKRLRRALARLADRRR